MKETLTRLKKYFWRAELIDVIAAILFGIWAIQDIIGTLKGKPDIFGIIWNTTFFILFILYWVYRDNRIKMSFVRFLFTIIWTVSLMGLLVGSIVTGDAGFSWWYILLIVITIAMVFMIREAWRDYNVTLFKVRCPGKPECTVEVCNSCPHFMRLMKYAAPKKRKKDISNINIGE